MELKRKRIAILLNWRKSWMGGIIYVVNLINVLNFLRDEDKPQILLFYAPDLKEFLKDIRYPHLEAIEWQFPHYAKAYVKSWAAGTNFFVKQIIDDYRPEGIYPLNDWPVSNTYFNKNNVRAVSWFPDLQHKFYPHFFTRSRVLMRELRIKLILRNTMDLAVSSKDVKGHFEKFYKLKSDLRIHTLRFVTILPEITYKSIEELKKLYAVPSEYFIVSNQFTNHKNHIVLLEALRICKQQGKQINFVLTGKTDFKGNEAYIARIRSMIKDYQLKANVQMLGVIPRADQLSLMKHSKAVVQPSLFEGWSTVIEDAKSLYVPVIAANLSVNMEQLGDTGLFFDPHQPEALAEILINFKTDGRHLKYEPYQVRAKNFAEDFVRIFDRKSGEA